MIYQQRIEKQLRFYAIPWLDQQATTHLDSFVKILFKVGGVHDAVFDWRRAIQDELVLDLLLRAPFHGLSRLSLLSDNNHFLFILNFKSTEMKKYFFIKYSHPNISFIFFKQKAC
jgi:hypothetical protein